MIIAHLCLSCFYIDGYAYQENKLVEQHVTDGHHVTVIASTEAYDSDRQPAYVKPGDYMGTDGARVIRLPYRDIWPSRLAQKFRAYPNVLPLLQSIKPDLIFFHGLCAWELLTAAKYVAENPATRLVVDCHEDFNNSARGFFSKNILHRCFYRPILQNALKNIDEVLCVTVESLDFAVNFYGVPKPKAKLFPLGGRVPDDEEYQDQRYKFRHSLGISATEIVIVQSGKITSSKLLPKALRAFVATKAPELRFLIAGQIIDHQAECQSLIDSDDRIHYLGWKSPGELESLLCAADIYLQPWGQTATTQMSMCCRCAIVVEDLPSHRALFSDNGFLLNKETPIETIFREISNAAQRIALMQNNSHEFAQKHLNYANLAKQVTHPLVLD